MKSNRIVNLFFKVSEKGQPNYSNSFYYISNTQNTTFSLIETFRLFIISDLKVATVQAAVEN